MRMSYIDKSTFIRILVLKDKMRKMYKELVHTQKYVLGKKCGKNSVSKVS